ncbi:MAG: ATP-binding cassette domain-containing protein [Bacteroidetes bacterium]|nr:ATP-binding cassette domain-containing protein [Bacteroidota bacterium]MBU1718857.1 ATP-binding cassette domain-containing protein [Bacteroidota bacterium]
MSEEILKALMQLFAIIAKQDVGTSMNEREFVHLFLMQQLSESSVKEYLALFDNKAGFDKDKKESIEPAGVQRKPRLTSVKDSVRTLGIAKKINKTLTQKQKAVVLVRLFELVNSDKNFTPQRMAIIDTVAEVFNITKEEYSSIQIFVTKDDPAEFDIPEIMVVAGDETTVSPTCKCIVSRDLDKNVLILRVSSVDLYFIRYTGSDVLYLNGLHLSSGRIYLFASGSVIKMSIGKPVFYTDIAAKFLADSSLLNIDFRVKDVGFTFPNGKIGLQSFSLAEFSGKLVGILGASGSGKTTLLNVLCGLDTPTHGEVTINGINLHKRKDLVKGVIGYIPQDDLLIEELTVFENLYFNAKLIFRNLTDEQIRERVLKVISNLGLIHAKGMKVGNPLDKKISGGQRKRLNIGLELLREPSILFVDEPTSGLSSRDSENVMELLRELTLRGKLIFAVIHQPSSDIFKMFDNVVIIDDGGFQIYYGNPVEAVMYFKDKDNQVNREIGECPTCGNVNPEMIFNIIEARIVDEYGQFTEKRKKTPPEWSEIFNSTGEADIRNGQANEYLPEPQKMPNRLKQFRIYFIRDLLTKLSNRQYLNLNLLISPVIAAVLAFILRYISDPESDTYLYRENDNITPYIFMAVIIALFLGLIVSAEEIYRDRKILKREAFLNLSRTSYLTSKISILFVISAIQALLFVIIGNSILEIRGMYFEYWLVFFSMAALANMLGLNISATFNSAVTIYILIPFLIIPQMVLAGALFSFDKINRFLGGGSENVPIIAEFMPSRWGFEALLVKQFVDNKYEQMPFNEEGITLYDLEKQISINDYKNVYYIPELKGIVEEYRFRKARNPEMKIPDSDLELLKNEFTREMKVTTQFNFGLMDQLYPGKYNTKVGDSVIAYCEALQEHYKAEFNKYYYIRDEMIASRLKDSAPKDEYYNLRDHYYNENLTAFAINKYAFKKLVRINNHFVQKIDPIFLDPQEISFLNYRTHFMAPRKYFLGRYFSTFSVNVFTIWLFTFLLYFTLYFETIKKSLRFLENTKPYIRKPFRFLGNQLSIGILVLFGKQKHRIKSGTDLTAKNGVDDEGSD